MAYGKNNRVIKIITSLLKFHSFHESIMKISGNDKNINWITVLRNNVAVDLKNYIFI